MNSDSSTQGAEYHSGWHEGDGMKECGCGSGNNFATRIQIIEVDFMSPIERAFFTSVRLGAQGVHAAGMGAKAAGMGAKTAYFGIVKALKRIPSFRDKGLDSDGIIQIPDKYFESFKKAIDAWTSIKDDVYEINDVTHDAVEILYRCVVCGALATYTYDICQYPGKMLRAGYYKESRRTKCSFIPDLNSIGFNFVIQKFYEMPIEYNLRTMNCKIWGRIFFESVVGSFREKRLEEERFREEERRLKDERRLEQMRRQVEVSRWFEEYRRRDEERRMDEVTRLEQELRRLEERRILEENMNRPTGMHFGSYDPHLAMARIVNAPNRGVMLQEIVANCFQIGQGAWREAARSLEVQRRLEEERAKRRRLEEAREKQRRLEEVTRNWENKTAARVEVREGNLELRGRDALIPFAMPSKADYERTMNSKDLYLLHEMYFYEHTERDPRWQRRNMLY